MGEHENEINSMQIRLFLTSMLIQRLGDGCFSIVKSWYSESKIFRFPELELLISSFFAIRRLIAQIDL